jgi:predicted RNA-binding protein with PUA-like domain
MAYWLLKTEPNDYSFDDLERDRRTEWDGVKNNLALKHMRDVRKGDEALVYHTGKERAAVGTARIVSDPYLDPQADSERIVVFDIRPGRRLKTPVTLAAVKADDRFADFALVRMSRLSVMPVPAALWKRLLRMGGLT